MHDHPQSPLRLRCLCLGLATLLAPALLGRGVSAAPPAPAPLGANAGIAAVRHGDLWVSDGSGRPARPVTHGGSFVSVSVGASGVAAVNDAGGTGPKTNVFVWKPPAPLARRVTHAGDFAGAPLWLPGTDTLLAGRGRPNADNDGGLWRVEAGTGATRRVLPDYDADYPVNNEFRLSPGGVRIVSEDGSEAFRIVQVLDAKTLRPLPPITNELKGLTDVAWLDDDTLLLSGEGGVDANFLGQGGIRAPDLRTRRLRRWLYAADADVRQLVRAPQGNLFAVGLGHVGDNGLSQHVRIIDARTKTGRPLPLPAPARVCGFSRDGSQLLVLMPARSGGAVLNAYAVDLRTDTPRLLLPDVSDAAWR